MLIRDPIHGDIRMTDLEKKVLDTSSLQRLRYIKQLGTGYLVYPGANHTRFEHSLGTAAVTKKILDIIRRRKPGLISDTQAERATVLSLIHDVTHIPYGHTFEDEMMIFDRHDKRQRYEAFFRDSDVGDILKDLDFLDTAIDMLSTKDSQTLDDPWMMQMVVETVCSDLLDYLRRDSYYTGLNKNYDDRLFQFMDVMESEDGRLGFVINMAKNNLLRRDVQSEILHLLKVRYFLTERVYYHHAKISSGAMISKALTIARDDYGLKKEDITHMGDVELHNYLRTIDRDGRISKILDDVQNRRLLKRAFVLTPSSIEVGGSEWYWLISEYHYPTGSRERLESEVADALSIEPDEVVSYCMGSTNFKEARVDVLVPDGVHSFEQLPGVPELTEMKKLYENLWRFYVFVPAQYVEKAGKVVEDILGVKNEYAVHSTT